MTASCAGLGILGPGPPDVTVYELPKRPALRVVPFADDRGVYPETKIYRLQTEPEGDFGLAAGFSREAWPAFQDWLREVLARFNANRCALLAVNGEADERCRLGGGLDPSREAPETPTPALEPAPTPQGAPAGWTEKR